MRASPDKQILFWEHAPGQRPQDFIRPDISRAQREHLANILASGHRGAQCRGWAECRICGAHLGSADLHGYGFMWPEKAEHYLLKHDVWTPGCDALYAAVAATGQQR